MNNRYFVGLVSALAAGLLMPTRAALALTIEENFNEAKTTNVWLVPSSLDNPNSACLTGVDRSDNTKPGSANIPACKTPTDWEGKGALRLTAATKFQRGAIHSNFAFDASQGVEIRFKTYTYGGTGADGMSFFLAKARFDSAGKIIPSAGASGGSLGYSCSNNNPQYDGVVNGYLGIGVDEWGNFLNKVDNTNSGVVSTHPHPNDDRVNQNRDAGHISVRGAGDLNYAALHRLSPSSYPDNASDDFKKNSVHEACSSGLIKNGTGTLTAAQTGKLFYEKLATNPDDLSSNMWNQSGQCDASGGCSRGRAKPISYKLKITADSHLSFWWAINNGAYINLINNVDLLPINGALPSKLVFGFAGATGGSTNVHEVACFQATPAADSNDSAAISLPTGQYKTGTQIYLASFHTENSWGSLQSKNLLINETTGTVALGAKANWDASCVLTGGQCTGTGVPISQAQGSSSRQIITYDGRENEPNGVPFTWNKLTPSGQDALSTNNRDDGTGVKRLAYLRGDRSLETIAQGRETFRRRNSILGDIVNSSPTWVGPPSAPYPTSIYSFETTWNDALYGQVMPENTGQTYKAFQTAQATRLNMVYVGANDGMLHAFRSGYYKIDGRYVGNDTTKPNDGRESFAFIPLVEPLHNRNHSDLDFMSTVYAHNSFVDATPGVGDHFYNKAWHTWLVGGMGSGGQAIYILDITNPGNFSEAQANKIVKAEFVFNPTADHPLHDLGKTFGTPQIRRLHNGQWGIIFGNGWCLANDKTCIGQTIPAAVPPLASNPSYNRAGIYIVRVDINNGNLFPAKFFAAPLTDPSARNGIAYVTPADLDGDHITDYIYAGDLLGNVWRFDLTSQNPADWGSNTKSIFKSQSGNPITTQVTVSSSKGLNDKKPRIIVNFGTGHQQPQTNESAAIYATGTQGLYGIWDWNMKDWNSKSTTEYQSLTSAPIINSGNLTTQSTQISGDHRTISNNIVCWQGSNTCNSGNTKLGWSMSLGSKTIDDDKTMYEQIIYNPVVVDGTLIVNTTIPPNDSLLSCAADKAEGWTIPLDPTTGGGLPGFFSGDFTDTVGYGINLNATGASSVVSFDNNRKQAIVTQTGSGNDAAQLIYPKKTGKRINWIQLR